MHKISTFLQCVGLIILFILLLCSPEAAFDGAWRGLKLWVFNLLPSLLPFLILSELLLSSKIVVSLGKLLEPLMRPIFHLPGACSFALALGFTSGFPMGAIAAASLSRQNLCTSAEAARLAAFTNNSSPLFILSAISVSMLGYAPAGIILLIAHYGANLCLGILLGFLAPKSSFVSIPTVPNHQYLPLGQALNQAVSHGIRSIINIGGFVTIFSVLIALCEKIGLFCLLDRLFAILLQFLGFSVNLSSGLSYGLFEMTLGINEISTTSAPLLAKLILISVILGWGGLSVHAQISAILSAENISSKYFLLLRPFHCLLSAILTITLFHFFLAQPVAVGTFFVQTITTSPVLSSIFITFLPLLLLLSSILIILLLRLGYILLWK